MFRRETIAMNELERMGFASGECQKIIEIGTAFYVAGLGVGPVELGELLMRERFDLGNLGIKAEDVRARIEALRRETNQSER